jgi:hypothetical protein
MTTIGFNPVVWARSAQARISVKDVANDGMD